MARRGRPPGGGRDEILASTSALLRERGVARLTTREIAARAGVSEGSIFYHFGDRAGLLKAVFDQALSPFREFRAVLPGPAPATSTDLRETLELFDRQVSAFLDDGLDVLLAAQADPDLRDEVGAMMAANDYGPHRGAAALAGYLVSAQRAGLVDPTVDVATVAYLFLSGIFLRATQPRLVGHDKGVVTAEASIDTVMAMLMRQT